MLIIVIMEVVTDHQHLIHPVSKGSQRWGAGAGVLSYPPYLHGVVPLMHP